jgi:transposase
MRISYPSRITESESALIALEKDLRGGPTAVRVQMLRLLKSGGVSSLTACATVLGYSGTQLQRWWAAYRDGGLDALLQRQRPPGKRSRITPDAWAGVQTELRAGHIAHLADAQRYLAEQWGIEYRSLNGIWWLFKQRRVKLKTGRRRHRLADATQQAAFKKSLLGR